MRTFSFDASQTPPTASNDDHPCDGTCFPGCDQVTGDSPDFISMLFGGEDIEGPTRAEDKVALGSILLALSKATEVFATMVAEDE